ncbi:MAG: protoheme IX farnesyltransferase [Armatimonadetes bacterium]|nr:protoheme IX farnesyltransferase [Armatimonadota bacterium]
MTAICTTILVFVGALVTTTDSGLAVPDWPLSFGLVFPKMVGGVAFEHGHRMLAAFVGLLTVILAVWASLSRSDRLIRRLAWLAVGMVVVQGLLGGLTVLMKLPVLVSVAHGTMAQLFFCIVVALVIVTSPSYRAAEPGTFGEAALKLRISSMALFVLVLLQLLLGATMRHMGAGLVIPDFPTSLGRWIPPLVSAEVAINFAHRVMALIVLLGAAVLIGRILRTNRHLPVLPALAWVLAFLVALQITLGAFTVWGMRAMIPTSLHVVNGALVLVVAFSILLWSLRLTDPAAQALEAREVSRPVTPRGAGAAPDSAHPALPRAGWKDWMELSKVRLVVLSAFTAGSGYWLGALDPQLGPLAAVSLGVLVMGAGGGILNHALEADTDARMQRTMSRPIPAGRVDVFTAEWVGGALGVAGSLFLGMVVHPQCGLLAILALVTYLLVYTPLKRMTPMCTLVGAVPGALPVLIGWVGARGTFDLGGWLLFLILFLWQLPHFMAIAWLCREDYARAGLPMMTVVDPEGRLAACQILVYCLALLPVSTAPTLLGMAGALYFFFALALGLGYLAVGMRMCWDRNTVRARQLLLASVVYLPAIYTALMLNR